MSTLPGDMSTLTKRLAGPSTAKAGMDTVDQAKVNDIIYKASEVFPLSNVAYWSRQGSKFFENERKKDEELTRKIDDMLKRLKATEGMDLSYEQRKADEKVMTFGARVDVDFAMGDYPWFDTVYCTYWYVFVTDALIEDWDAFYASVEELDRPELKYLLLQIKLI
jgi:DNA polymerase kappa